MYFAHFEINDESKIITEGYLSPCLEINKDFFWKCQFNFFREGSPLLNIEGDGHY